MKSIIKTIAVAFVATLTLTSCSKDDDGATGTDESNELRIVTQFVDHTVAPTYSALAAHAEQLAEQLIALRANPTQSALEEACNTFLAAREQWEKSEAFLFGAAGDFGVDPHIDSWPLDENAFNNLMSSPSMLEALDDEDGDMVAGEQLGNALLGFHGIEYILFKEGHAKPVAEITSNEWIYVTAVAGDLRNRCFQLEVSWMGDAAPASHIEKLEEIELPYTVASGDDSYGDNMKNAGQAGSTYRNAKSAVMAMVQGCIDIADEVGTSKIGMAYTGADLTYIESPYSQNSVEDFYNNIISIRNSYMGGIEGQRDESRSLHHYVAGINSQLDSRVQDAIQNALDKIDAMPHPFVNNISAPANGEAMEACAALSDVLSEVVEEIRNN